MIPDSELWIPSLLAKGVPNPTPSSSDLLGEWIAWGSLGSGLQGIPSALWDQGGVDFPCCEDQQGNPGWRWHVGCGRVMELGLSGRIWSLGGAQILSIHAVGSGDSWESGTCKASLWCGPRDPCASGCGMCLELRSLGSIRIQSQASPGSLWISWRGLWEPWPPSINRVGSTVVSVVRICRDTGAGRRLCCSLGPLGISVDPEPGERLLEPRSSGI